jgi:hypothetical protein
MNVGVRSCGPGAMNNGMLRIGGVATVFQAISNAVLNRFTGMLYLRHVVYSFRA